MARLLPRVALGAAAICALAACAGAPAAPQAAATSAPATAAPVATSAPAATAAPAATEAATAPAIIEVTPATAATAEATAPAAEGGVLPAPLYVGVNGQIERIERDGTTRATITSEPSDDGAMAVTELAAAPGGNQLAYVVQKQGGGVALVTTDGEGKNRTVLFDKDASSITSLVWSPDGSALITAISQTDAASGAMTGGVYRIPAAGGEPSLIQANDVLTQTATTASEVLPDKYGYTPQTFSPDGKKLLLVRYSLQVEQSDQVVIPAEGGPAVSFAQPSSDLHFGGISTAWSRDSASLYTTFTPGDDRYIYGAGLWRTSASSGTSEQVIPSEVGGKVPIVIFPFETADGRVLAFVGESPKLPSMFEEDVQNLPSFQLAELDLAKGSWKVLREESFFSPTKIAWAPDGSGAAIWYNTREAQAKFTWLPVDGQPVELGKAEDLSGFSWGS
ncbi:hypothetical protein F8S13_16070 [Chloroflexia bacterium SDU3-3]|nr:hypothetical protein F8S13_16070 [Chloroflexia bacterium SDU3-3]